MAVSRTNVIFLVGWNSVRTYIIAQLVFNCMRKEQNYIAVKTNESEIFYHAFEIWKITMHSVFIIKNF